MAIQTHDFGHGAVQDEAVCQIRSPARFAEGLLPLQDRSLRMRAHMAVKRRLPMSARRELKRQRVRFRRWRSGTPHPAPVPTDVHEFEAGDLVKVRSGEEIVATLDRWQQLRGCGFLEEMVPYCGTTQRVLKPVRRFVDERDYRVKKARGVYLLDGVMCEGAEPFGPCDRGCLYFWREEWLEPA